MGELEGIPCVAPLFLSFFGSIGDIDLFASFCRFSCFSHGGIHIIINHATLDKCDHTNTNALDPIRNSYSSTLRCDHTTTNASGPIRTLQLRVLGQ
ncbi:hypothetical protein CR513_50477, partial [Mucuna pruriens]